MFYLSDGMVKRGKKYYNYYNIIICIKLIFTTSSMQSLNLFKKIPLLANESSNFIIKIFVYLSVVSLRY